MRPDREQGAEKGTARHGRIKRALGYGCGIVVLAVVSLSAYFFLCGTGRITCCTTLARLDLGRGRTLLIEESMIVDEHPDCYYSIREGSDWVVRRAYLGSIVDDGFRNAGFAVISADSGNVVGVTLDRPPYTLVCFHDFTKQTGFPVDGSLPDTSGLCRAMGLLQAAHLEMDLSLWRTWNYSDPCRAAAGTLPGPDRTTSP